MNKYNHIPKKILSKTESLMLHGIGFVSGDPTIQIHYPYLYHPGLNITVTEPGEAKWIYLMLPIRRGSLITDINIAHRRTGLHSHISLIRVIEQREPVSATVLFDEYIDKNLPASCIVSSSCRIVVNNSVMLKVCMDFTDTDDVIELGSVEINYIPDYSAFPSYLRKDIEDVRHNKRWLADLVNFRTSMNTQRLSLLEKFHQKKEKKKVSY